ncbi:MAG: hypothetical protein KDK11_00135 [Maritimibacter sp.]|nr:hypothetical protein [Maritimibacter sp.]
MSRVQLLPRLKDIGVAQLLDTSTGAPPTPAQITEIIGGDSPFVWVAASGGSFSDQLTRALVEGLVEIASKNGYPNDSSRETRAMFDAEAAIWLGDHAALATGELLRDDVWAFLATALIPGVVSWRFPEQNPERYFGGVRNTFQRLWMRGVTLDLGETHPDRWKLVRELSEDAMVAIFERPAIASDPRLARGVAAGWVETAQKIGRGKMERVMRQATIILRVRNQVLDLGHLDDEGLLAVVNEAFEVAAGTAEASSSVRSSREDS